MSKSVISTGTAIGAIVMAALFFTALWFYKSLGINHGSANDPIDPTLDGSIEPVAATEPGIEVRSIEGYDSMGNERAILQGVDSSQIPTDKRTDSDGDTHVAPYDSADGSDHFQSIGAQLN